MQPSGLLRNMRNVVHNYTEVEIKVREATSNDPWGPSSSIMAEISDLTYQAQPFPEIMAMLWKRLSDHGKNWRHVYKSLMLLDYLVKTGSERVAAQCKENIYAITTLKDFQFIDRDGKDQGTNVRERAKQLVSLLQDEDRLKAEREKSLKNKERFSKSTTGIGSHSGSHIGYSSANTSGGIGLGSDTRSALRTSGEEELQLQLALAMSKEEADEAEKARREDQVRVELAIKESLKEAENGPPGGIPPQTVIEQTKKPQSNIDDLLNLDLAPEPVQQPQTNFNPWGGGGGGAPAPAADPFGAPAPSADPFGAPADPWGAPSSQPPPQPATTADPWGSTAPSQAADPFGQASAFPPSNSSNGFGASPTDPFGAPPPATNTQPPPAATDPFGQPTGINNNPASSDLFSLPPTNPEPAAQQASPFDLDGLGTALPEPTQPTAQEKRTAQSFLGSAAGLVNLDNLVQRPKQPAATNPFGMTSLSTQAKSNPFHNTSPGPSMAEMAQNRQTQQLGLQQPMAPSPVGGSNPMNAFGGMTSPQAPQQNIFGVQPMSNQNQFNQPQMSMSLSGDFGQSSQKTSNNPFL